MAQTTPGAQKPVHIGPVTRFEDRSIQESSGVVASRKYRGFLWTHNDGGHGPKLFATDKAQEVIDTAVQLHGGDGVRRGSVVERLYREIRALRIYEGASDVQKLIIARQTLAGGEPCCYRLRISILSLGTTYPQQICNRISCFTSSATRTGSTSPAN